MEPIKPKTTTAPPAISEPKPAPQARPQQPEDRIEGGTTTQSPADPLAAGDAVSAEIVARFAALAASMGEINGEVAELGDVDIEV